MRHRFTPRGVCSSKIEFDLQDNQIHNLVFTSGCSGNLKAIATLVEGMEADRVVSLLSGNTCGFRDTSCADQLARAIVVAQQAEKQNTCATNATIV
ncbi:MAG: TIGR03905 family TSCPD domain-containing protein [Christensenella sp.]|nr:TIGR03905 family TSCPD domain-containing protein [Christensenella sp.]